MARYLIDQLDENIEKLIECLRQEDLEGARDWSTEVECDADKIRNQVESIDKFLNNLI